MPRELVPSRAGACVVGAVWSGEWGALGEGVRVCGGATLCGLREARAHLCYPVCLFVPVDRQCLGRVFRDVCEIVGTSV